MGPSETSTYRQNGFQKFLCLLHCHQQGEVFLTQGLLPGPSSLT
ncbi:rCG59599 [Rattus norvegicus]|uniref:RCG59599 n=1 Tax=Rattus norvegicus TaxID=10116 RepID=A6HTC0_RAT|nr:rCG59599 [Rattus norvegicus]